MRFMGLILAFLASTVWAAPVVEGVVQSSTVVASISHIANLPSGIQYGEKLILCAVTQSVFTTASPSESGWSPRVSHSFSGGGMKVLCHERTASGSEASTVGLVSNNATELQMVAFRISGAAADQFAFAVAVSPKVCAGFSCNYNSSAPNPPNLNPAGWDVEDTLWVEVVAHKGGNSVVSYSSGYDDGQSDGNTGGAYGLGLASAADAVSAASQDPGVLSTSLSRPWVAVTIAVRPAP